MNLPSMACSHSEAARLRTLGWTSHPLQYWQKPSPPRPPIRTETPWGWFTILPGVLKGLKATKNHRQCRIGQWRNFRTNTF